MKTIFQNFFRIILLCLSFSPVFTTAQDWIGYNTSNYTGIHSINFQPASIVDSRYKFDMNFAAVDMTLANNYYYAKWDLVKSSFAEIKKKNWDGLDSIFSLDDFEDLFLFENLDGSAKSAFFNTNMQGPSFMVNLTKNDAVGLFTRFRTQLNIDDVDEPLAKSAREAFDDSNYWMKKYKDDNLSIQFNTWAEYGLSYGRVLFNENEHFLKAGVNLKVLQGLGAAYLFVRNFDYMVHNQDTIDVVKTDFSYGHTSNFRLKTDSGGIPTSGPEVKYKFEANPSIGFDIGLVYEYRPDYDKYKYDMDGKTGLIRKDENKYKIKIGFSLLDWGRMKYTRDTNSFSFYADTSNLALNVFDKVRSTQDLDSIINNLYKIKNDEGDYKMSLPTSLSIQIDWNIYKGFYLNFSPFFSLKSGATDENKTHYLTSYTFTPRWEGQWGGVYLPVSFNKIMGTDVGLALRLGPLVIGTRDLFGSYMGKAKFGDANYFLALRAPIPYGKIKDRDHDKVSNKKDRCPKVKGTWEFRGCPDIDGDHVQDELDSCPDLAGSPEFSGCPDSDGDGVPDKNDSCPFLTGVKYYGGCPDNDHDSVPDYRDKCPDIAGDKSNYGCPLADTDKDGVPDKTDKCITVPGPISNNGCPILKKEDEKIVKKAFDNLQFETGKAIILKTSYKSLNDLAALMKKNPSWKLYLAGHTDNVGSRELNMKLSQNRAKAVAKYLEDQGVNDDQFIIRWFGPDRPIADNSTPLGRQKNRRVEFKLIMPGQEAEIEKQTEKEVRPSKVIPGEKEKTIKTDKKGSYYITLGSFKNKDKLYEIVSQWEEKGIKVKIVYSKSKETYYITAGKFSDKKEAEKMKNSLKEKSIDCWINFMGK